MPQEDKLKKFLDKNAGVPMIGVSGNSLVDDAMHGKYAIATLKEDKKKLDPVTQAQDVLVTKILNLTSAFFSFYKLHRDDERKCEIEVARLDLEYEAWLIKHKHIYDVVKCRPFFLTRMEENFDTSMLHLQMRQGPPEKK